MTSRVMALGPEGRRIMYLEGGYDLGALARCAGACVAAMAGVEHSSEPTTSGGPGTDVIEKARRLRV